MTIALVLLCLAALPGLFMAGQRLRGRDRPRREVAAAHGILAATGLGLLARAALGGGPRLRFLLALFALTALGGLGLLAYHARREPLPAPLLLVHGGLALLGLGLLLGAVLGGR